MDRGKGGCQQAATHKVNKPTRAVRAADLAETRQVSRTISSISPIALPRLRQYYGEMIGIVCQYVRDVGVAGSNPVTPTIDFPAFFPTKILLGARSTGRWGRIWGRNSGTNLLLATTALAIGLIWYCASTITELSASSRNSVVAIAKFTLDRLPALCSSRLASIIVELESRGRPSTRCS